VRVKGLMLDSWLVADCDYDPGSRVFTSTDSKGKQRVVPYEADCWAVDVPHRAGMKQHRFDVVSTQSTVFALAAASEVEKQRWLAVFPTKVHVQMGINGMIFIYSHATKYNASCSTRARASGREGLELDY
jgi:hypothetical protein